MRKRFIWGSEKNDRVIEEIVRFSARSDIVKQTLLQRGAAMFFLPSLPILTEQQRSELEEIDRIPIPIFQTINDTSPLAKTFDIALWEALRNGNGSEDEVWRHFRQQMASAKKGMKSILGLIKSASAGLTGRSRQRLEASNRYAQYRHYFISQHLRNPHVSFTRMKRLAAQHFNVSSRTISRATRDLKF